MKRRTRDHQSSQDLPERIWTSWYYYHLFDDNFTMVEEVLRPVHVEIPARGEYVGDIERDVRTVKYEAGVTTSLSYTRVPRVTIDANIEDKVHSLNKFTPRDYIHPTMGPSGMPWTYKMLMTNTFA